MYVNLKPVLQALLAAAATALAPAASAGGTHNAFEASALAHQSAATDRMIVKYRDTEGIAQAMANRMSSDRMQQLLSRAAQHGLRLARLRSTA
ncbi:MAG TPA: hypothetical protein VFP68_04595, partial [Burkholderiaceae bacterium]|nr:hypothetical protein [Burkholderiaceae bacterium]